MARGRGGHTLEAAQNQPVRFCFPGITKVRPALPTTQTTQWTDVTLFWLLRPSLSDREREERVGPDRTGPARRGERRHSSKAKAVPPYSSVSLISFGSATPTCLRRHCWNRSQSGRMHSAGTTRFTYTEVPCRARPGRTNGQTRVGGDGQQQQQQG